MIILLNGAKFDPREYMNIPYRPHGRDRSGIDCWGLDCLVYQEKLNIDLPSYAGEVHDITNPQEVGPLFDRGRDGLWYRVDGLLFAPLPGDVIGWRAGKIIYHVGLYLGGHLFFHIQKNTEAMISEVGSVLWPERRMAGIYRHKEFLKL